MKRFLDDGNPSKEFYLFLKYNKIFDKEKVENLNVYEIEMYNEFCRLFREFENAFDTEDSTKSSMLFGAISSMFGYNRHYCSITGQPILGNYYKIGGKIVSKEAYESYKIILELEKKHSLEEKTKLEKENKFKNKSQKNIPTK